MNLLLRVVLFLAGLVVAASLAFAFVLLLAIWLLRAAWARLTGRPATPFVMRVDPRAGFGRVYPRGYPQSDAPPAQDDEVSPAGSSRRPRAIGDVTDVEPKP